MGCSGSKVVESVQEGLASEAGQKATESIASTVLPSEQEELHKDLHQKMKHNDKHLQKMELARRAAGPSDSGGGGAPGQADAPPALQPSTARAEDGDGRGNHRGDIASSQKDALRGRYGLNTMPTSSSNARTPLESPRNEPFSSMGEAQVGQCGPSGTTKGARDGVNGCSIEEAMLRDDQRAVILQEQVLLARRERDAAQAETRRISGERDAIRADLVYLRAASEASDHFQDVLRIPPEWVPSEQQRMSQMRDRIAELENDVVVLKHSVRRHTMTVDANNSYRRVTPTPLSGGGPSHSGFTTVSWPAADGAGGGGGSASVFEASLNSEFPPSGSTAVVPTASSVTTGGAFPHIPNSPTELLARVSELQMQCRTSERDAQQWAAASQRTREQSQAEAHRLQHEIQQLRHQQTSEVSAASAKLLAVRAEWEQLCGAVDEKRREYEGLERSIAAAEEAVTAANNDRAREAEAEEAQRRSLVAAAAAKEKEESLAAQFLKQVSRLLVDAEHCPDSVRLELLQFVCEHGGLRIEGRAPLVVDATVFDMNGILYGDCLAHLASVVLQRHSCRIESLLLSETAMTDLGVAQLSLTIAVLPFETSLALMNISNNDITCRGAMQLLTALGCAASGCGSGATIRHRLVVDLDNNPMFATLEDAKMVLTQVEEMKKSSPLIEVLLPRVPKLEQLAGSAAALARTSSVFAAAAPSPPHRPPPSA